MSGSGHPARRKEKSAVRTVLLMSVALSAPLLSQIAPFPFLDPSVPLETRIADLLGRMTLEEKVRQLLYNAPAIDRLSVPEYNWWGEALHGVARAGKATVFPQAIGLAATWDRQLIFDVATAISDEARAKHHHALRMGRRGIYDGLTFWSPNINIFRDARWGRGMETYGEDPYLTGALAVQFVKGMQGDDPKYLKTIATPKHFAVHSGPEPDRHTFDARVSERDLRETYLPAFRASITEGGAQSVMCAYNRFRGAPCCGSDELLRSILRTEWKFKGYVVSDCWAVMDIYNMQYLVPTAAEAAAMALSAGTDLNCGVAYDSLIAAIRQGIVKENLVDRSLQKLLRARFRLGMFDPPELVSYAQIPASEIDSRMHRRLAVEAARKSLVLLKNEGGLLPLTKDVRSIAVLGPNAADVEVLLGNYNGTPVDPRTILAGIREGAPVGTNVVHARGTHIAEHTPSLTVVPASIFNHKERGRSVPGLRAEYFNSYEWEGEPDVVRIDSCVDFNWWEAPPAGGLRPDSFSIRWSGILTPPVGGRYALGARVFGEFRLFLDDTLFAGFSDWHVVLAQTAMATLEKGKEYAFRLEFRDRRADASIQCVWEVPNPWLKQEALDAARAADVVVMVMGLSPRLEGEEMPVTIDGFSGGDRTDIRLPAMQEELIRDVSALGKPVVLILLNGSALAVEYAAENIPVILESWYPGQAGGEAVADVLFGKSSPGGRLPVTFYRSVSQLPPFHDYSMDGRTYRYWDGEPLYPFGYGLSYTTFKYSNLRIADQVQAGKEVVVSVDIENAGPVDGDEVVQVYVKDIEASVPTARQSLAGFERINLPAGKKRSVSFVIDPRAFSLIDSTNQRVIERGWFEVSVGGEQPGMTGRLHAPTTETLTKLIYIFGSTYLNP